MNVHGIQPLAQTPGALDKYRGVTFGIPSTSQPDLLFPISPPADRRGASCYGRGPAQQGRVSYKVLFILLASHHPRPDHVTLSFQRRLWKSQKHLHPCVLGFGRDHWKLVTANARKSPCCCLPRVDRTFSGGEEAVLNWNVVTWSHPSGDPGVIWPKRGVCTLTWRGCPLIHVPSSAWPCDPPLQMAPLPTNI